MRPGLALPTPTEDTPIECAVPVGSPAYRQNPNSYLFVQGNGLRKSSIYQCKETVKNC